MLNFSNSISPERMNNHVDLNWLPKECNEQLELAFRIISTAHKTRVTSLEAEVRSLRIQLEDKNAQIGEMQTRSTKLETQLIEETSRSNQLGEENKQLASTIRKLHKDITRLENLKKAVLTSIQEERIDADDSAPKYYSPDDMIQSQAPRTMQEILSRSDSIPSTWGLGFSSDRSLLSNSNSGRTSLIPMQGSKMDGKAFFKLVRSRLSIEKFKDFIENIKKLNEHVQNREETLAVAEKILGESNSDIYQDFKLMLYKQILLVE